MKICGRDKLSINETNYPTTKETNAHLEKKKKSYPSIALLPLRPFVVSRDYPMVNGGPYLLLIYNTYTYLRIRPTYLTKYSHVSVPLPDSLCVLEAVIALVHLTLALYNIYYIYWSMSWLFLPAHSNLRLLV